MVRVRTGKREGAHGGEIVTEFQERNMMTTALGVVEFAAHEVISLHHW
jgi:hypothetical protein